MQTLKWLLPPTFTLLAFTLTAQIKEGFKFLDKKDYAAAQSAFATVLSDKEDGLAATWGMAQALAATDNPTHDYDSAYILAGKTTEMLRKVKDSKDKKKLAKKYKLTTSDITKLTKPLAENRWKEIDGQGKLGDLEHFQITYSKRIPVKIKNKAQQQYQQAFKSALNSARTYEAMRSLLVNHDKLLRDSFADRQKYLQTQLFPTYMEENGGKLETVNAFFTENPGNIISTDRSRKAFETAAATNTTKGYLNFISTNSESVFAPYIFKYVEQSLAANPMQPADIQQLSQDEKWLVEDITAGRASGVKVNCYNSYDGKGLANWLQFIRRHAPDACGNNALHAVVKYSMKQKDWAVAAQALRETGALFPNDSVWVKKTLALVDGPESSAKAVNAGKNINSTEGSEYVPTLSADGQTLAFCADNRNGGVWGEDVFISEWKDSIWGPAKLVRELSGGVQNHQSPMCFTADGNAMYMFENGKVYYSERTASGWGTKKDFPVNTKAFGWVSDVQFGVGGQIVFFAARSGSFSGTTHIYMAQKDENGLWSMPKELDAPVNLPSETSRSPFIHPDMKTLYFSSNRADGFGDLDVYRCVRLDETWTKWSEPVNLGKSINTTGQDWGYIVSTEGSTAWFSAQQSAGSSSQDLFYIELPQEARPEKAVQPMSVVVKDKSGKEMTNTIVDVRNTQTGSKLGTYTTPPNSGKITVFVPEGESVTISTSQKGKYSTPLVVRAEQGKKQTKPIEMSVITTKEVVDGGKSTLNTDILFDIGKAELKPEAAGQIKFLADFAKNENLTLTLSGHTDPTGSDTDNMTLSQARAEAVKAALVGSGVVADKIKAIGFGETQLECKENTPECLRANRRVEIEWKKG